MDLPLRAAAQLHAGHDPKAVRARRLSCGGQPRDAVVIADGDDLKTRLRRACYQLAGGQRPVRSGGVQVQIRLHPQSSCLIAGNPA